MGNIVLYDIIRFVWWLFALFLIFWMDERVRDVEKHNMKEMAQIYDFFCLITLKMRKYETFPTQYDACVEEVYILYIFFVFHFLLKRIFHGSIDDWWRPFFACFNLRKKWASLCYMCIFLKQIKHSHMRKYEYFPHIKIGLFINVDVLSLFVIL